MRKTGGALSILLVVPLLAGVLAAAACHQNSPSPPPCTYTLTATTLSFGATGGTGSVGVQTGPTCAWTAKADFDWIAITGSSTGTGPGTVAFTVAANADRSVRDGSLTVAGKPVSIRQDARQVDCTYTITPESAVWPPSAGSGHFDSIADAACSWTVDSSATWISITSERQGSGSTVVAYTVARNNDATDRNSTIRAGGQIFSVRQTGDTGTCQYSVSPVSFAPCMRATELTSDVVTQAGCPWTAAPGASWITLMSGGASTGSGTARFTVSANYDAPRNGVVMLRWPTATAGQNLQIAQAGCTYGVSTTRIDVPVSGGSASFDVLQESVPNTCGGPLQNACIWSAQSSVPWITITSSMPKTGDDRVGFTVAPNGTGAARTGTITVRDKSVTVAQAGS